MSDEPTIPFKPKGKPEQLSRAQLTEMFKRGEHAEIKRARNAGHLEDLLTGKKPAPPEVK